MSGYESTTSIDIEEVLRNENTTNLHIGSLDVSLSEPPKINIH